MKLPLLTLLRFLSYLLCFALPALATPKRVALIIGNNEYQHIGKLANPKRDAAAVAATLTKLEFDVAIIEDATVESFYAGLETLKERANGAELVLLFFAGHGVEIASKNYLLPVDAELANPAQLRTQTVPLEAVLEELNGAEGAAKVAILDCCRNDPLTAAWKAGRASGSGGLADIKDNLLPKSSLVMFSAGPGQVAADGAGENSPFTASLVKRLMIPGQSLFDAFLGTSDDVMVITNKRQEPWLKFDGAGRDFRSLVMVPGGAGVAPGLTSVPPTPGTDHFILPAGQAAGERKLVEVAPGVSLPFRWCPPGSFTMGSPMAEQLMLQQRNVIGADEKPHSVTLTKGFWLAETEVTQGQWQAVMERNLLEQAEHALDDDTLYLFGETKQTWRDFQKKKVTDAPEKIARSEGDQLPVYLVNHEEAMEWCATASRKAKLRGWSMVLPTEAQWEYACRAGTNGMSYIGDFEIEGKYKALKLDVIGWYGGNSCKSYPGKGWDVEWQGRQYTGDTAGPRRVGLKASNAWGLSDMLGNVFEWCSDVYGPYSEGSEVDPQGQKSGESRVFRGGSWIAEAVMCRAAFRGGNNPGYRGISLGFRPALVPSR